MCRPVTVTPLGKVSWVRKLTEALVMFPLASRVILKVRTVNPDAPLGSGTGGAISLTVLIGTVTVSVSAIAGEDSNKTTNPIRIAVARPTAFIDYSFQSR